MLLVETSGINKNKAAQIICYAIYHGFIYMENFSTQNLSMETILRKKNRNLSNPFVPFHIELHTDSKYNLMKELPSTYDISLKIVTRLIPSQYEEQVIEREKVVCAWLSQPSHLRIPSWRKEFLQLWSSKLKYNSISEKTIYRKNETSPFKD